jgi:serine/threonine protein kinase
MPGKSPPPRPGNRTAPPKPEAERVSGDDRDFFESAPVLRPPPGPNLVGKILAERYQILKCLAEGGMGTVYLAEHTTIGRRLAVKVLSPDVGSSPEMVQRFLQEARAASMIQHEHIVDIIDFGYTAQGQAFLAMELLDGEDLATTLDREKRIPWPRLRRMVLQICRALNAAHEKGIIHRDMKPDNCFRIKRGGNADFIKLLDFGIAKVMTEATTSRGKHPVAAATAAGTLLGTPEYMAPELARDGVPDGRVDIYALGVMMYELLTGDVPFRGETFMATVAKHMTQEPTPPSERCPEAMIPPPIEAVILRAMAKDPAERYQNVRELTEAIIGADKQLRSTGLLLQAVSDGLPEEISSVHTTGAHAVQTTGAHNLQTLQGGASIHTTGAHAPLPPQPAPVDTYEDHDAVASTRPNPYRWLSALLLLLLVGVGLAYWKLKDQGEEARPPQPGDAALSVVDGAAAAPSEKTGPAATTAAASDPPQKPPASDDPPLDPRFAELAPISDDERRQVSADLQDHVRKCAKSFGIRREDQPKVRVSLRVEAATGKLDGDLPASVYGNLFGKCIIEALKIIQFQPGRKYMRFDLDFAP